MQIPFAQKHSLVWTSFTIVANQILRFKTPTEKWLMYTRSRDQNR